MKRPWRRYTLPTGLAAGVLIGAFSIEGSLSAPPDSLQPYERRDDILDGGAQLIIVRGEPGSGAAVLVSFEAGEVHVPSASKGLATLAARCLLGGSKTRPGHEFSAALNEIGGALAIRSTADLIEAAIEVPSERLPEAIDLLAELLAEPAFPESLLAIEKDALVADVSSELHIEEAARAVLARMVFDRHPYAYLPTAETIATIDAEALRTFHRERLGSQGATIVVAGEALDDQALERRARRAFDGLGAGTPPDRRRPAPLAQMRRRVILVHRGGETNAAVAVGNIGIRSSDPDALEALLVAYILEDPERGRIPAALARGGVPAFHPQAAFDVTREPGLFVASSTFEDAWIDSGAAVLLNELDRVRHEPIAADEVDIAIAAHDIAYAEHIARALGLARETAETAVAGLRPDWIETRNEALHLISSLDVSRAARRMIRPYASPLVFAGDGTRIAAAIARFGQVEWVDERGNPIPEEVTQRASTTEAEMEGAPDDEIRFESGASAWGDSFPEAIDSTEVLLDSLQSLESLESLDSLWVPPDSMDALWFSADSMVVDGARDSLGALPASDSLSSPEREDAQ